MGNLEAARAFVVPTHVGMARRVEVHNYLDARSPHTHGDGPASRGLEDPVKRSPHTRGDGPYISVAIGFENP